MAFSNDTRNSEIVLSEGVILIRPSEEGILLEWKHQVVIKNVVCHEHVCKLIDKDALLNWISVLENTGVAETQSNGLRIEKNGNQATLSFLSTIGKPNSTQLNQQQQHILASELLHYRGCTDAARIIID